jgi:hypothetical protein
VYWKDEGSDAWRPRYAVLEDGVLGFHKASPAISPKEIPHTIPPLTTHLALQEAVSLPVSDASGGRSPRGSDEIQLDTVTAVRTADDFGDCAFQIVTSDRTYVLRAPQKDDMQVSRRRPPPPVTWFTSAHWAWWRTVKRRQDWLFAFHRSLAGIVARLREPASNQNGLRRQPIKDLGHGHGRRFERRYGPDPTPHEHSPEASVVTSG